MNDTDPRYPIGRLRTLDRPLTPEEREERIAAIEAHPGRMRTAVAGLDDAQLDTPYRDGGWTVRQVVHHVVDSHVNAYVRFKLTATEEHPTIGTYQQAAWAELPDAKHAPVEASLDVLDTLHRRWVAFLRNLEPSDFTRTARHPEVGEVTLDTLLQIYGWHGPHHEAHVTTLREREGW